MLTVQPRFTQITQQRNSIAFRGEDVASAIPDDKYYQDKQDYYQNQINEIDTLMDDKHTPNSLKKVLKGCRVVSEGLLEGCAVAWGASKGAKVIKSTAIKGANSKFTKGTKEVLKPILEGFKATGSKIWKALGDKVTAFKASKFATGTAEKFTKLVEKMNNNKVGKVIVQVFEGIGKAFKYVGKKASEGFQYLSGKVKAMKGDEVYDKTANIASKALGTGAGVAGAYNAATRAEERGEERKAAATQVEESEDDYVNYDEVDEVEQFIEDGE